jgi:hypothetical protein
MAIPHIYKYRRSASGFRVWFSGPELNDRRFIYVINGTTLILEERPVAKLQGNVVRNFDTKSGTVGVWTAPLLGGAEFGREGLHIAAETIFEYGEPNLLTYQIPDIPELAERPSQRGSVFQPTRAQVVAARQSTDPQQVTEAPLANPGPVVDVDKYLLSILEAIDRMEETTYHRLVKEDGVWEWRTPPIRRAR